MNKTPNKYINIESFNTINNSSSKKGFITVNRLNSKYNNNKTQIIQRRNNIISESNNEFKPFIYKKKSKLEKSNSFYVNNKRNLSLRDKSITKEPKPLLLIPSYKHFDFRKNYKTYTNNNNNSKSNKKLKKKCKLYLSRNSNNQNSKDKNKRNTFNNKIRYSQSKTKGISNNSTGISIIGDSNKKNVNKNNNKIKKYNCYSYDDEMTIKDEQNSDYYSKDTNEDNLSLCLNNKNKNDDKKNNKYIKIIEKENELLKNELLKTNKKLSLLEKKIENIIEGKILRHNTQTILTNSRSRIQTYMKNNIIKKCPVPTPYVQKFSKNDFFSTKHKDIKVTLKLHNRMNNEESKNNC